MRGDPITVASDVYSLGVLLFRLLADTSPYRPDGRTDAAITRAICEEEPRRPSEVVADGNTHLSPREIALRRRELSGDLDLITLKALSKEPERRYGSVDRLARDIRRHLDGQPVEAAPDSRTYRARKFLRRHRAGVAVAAAIALTTGAGLVATLLEARVARIERERAERRFNDVRALAGSMIFEVHDAIESLPGSTVARELLIRRALGYLDRLASEPGADASLQRELAAAYARIAEVQGNAAHSNLGQQKAALESYRKALAIRESLARAAPWDAGARREVAAMQRNVGTMLSTIGESASALGHLRTAVTIDERLAADRPREPAIESELGKSYVALSDGLVPLADWPQALALLQKALPPFRHAAAAAPGDVKAQRALALAYKRIGGIEAKLKDYANALAAYESALAIDQARFASDPDNPEVRMDVSLDVSDVGFILYHRGDNSGALAQFERVRAIREDLVRADPNDTRAKLLLASAIVRIGATQWALGNRETALGSHRQALVLYDALAAAMPADVSLLRSLAEELALLGTSYAKVDAGRGRPVCGRARPFLVRALDAYRALVAKGQVPSEYSRRVSELQATLARCGTYR